MMKQIRKKGAIAILLPVFLGLAQFGYATISGINNKIIDLQKDNILHAEQIHSNKEMLTEIRNDVKVLLQRSK